jgi:thiol-disulfide isomerase/thioredoxin
MMKNRLTSCLLLAALAAPVAAAPTVEQMLSFKPRQEGVVFTTPNADKLAGCKVELVKGQQQGSGWALKDEEGNLLRRYFNTRFTNVKDGTRIDVWSYYKDGQEVYREWSTANGQAPDQYRWFNAGGSKWGIDENRDGKIDTWKTISPEEVGQEILAALMARDFTRLQPLLLTEAELKSLDLPSDQANRIRESLKAAREKFEETAAKLKLSPKATWIHLETVAPQCVVVEGAHGEVIKHARATLLYDNGGGSDWIQTGEMYQVGNAWRIVAAPTPGASAPESSNGKTGNQLNLEENPELQKLIGELTDLDKQVPAASGSATNPALAQHHLKRAEVLERIVAKVKESDRDPWVRQVADSLSTAAQSDPSASTAMTRLLELERQLSSAQPTSALTAYVTYREMQADYSRSLPPNGKETNFNKIQETWLGRLAKFAQAFPRAEDTPDALLQAGMVSEFLNKEVEAKNWYKQLKENFGDKPQAKKAEGSIRRLDLEGQPLSLTGPMLNDPNTNFDLNQKQGKVSIVYYWASWNNQCTGDFTKLKSLLDTHAGKVELVCVNLDNGIDEARRYLSSTPAPGTHLHQDGGLESKMATDFGIQVLPTIFLVGKDGKVVSRNGQIANLEDEVKKLLK